MTLDDLERQNRDFLWIFRAISDCDTKSFTRRRHGTGGGGVASLVTHFGCKEVTQRRARLVLRWVTACGQKLL